MIKESKIIVIPEGKVCDYIDGEFRNDSPEEYVRQTVEKRLVNEHKYPKESISIEHTLILGSRKPRADIVIFNKEVNNQNQENINIIIECKAETIEPKNAKDGIGQLQSYMSACVNCKWGMWTNGRHKFVFRKVKDENGNIVFQEYNDIPSVDGSVDDIDRPKRNTLKKAVDDNLLFTFKICHNHIYVNDGLQKQPAFFELLKVIFCKIEDERNIPHPLEFYAKSQERSNPDGQLTIKKRIDAIFRKVKQKYNAIFETNDEIALQPRSLAYIISEFQKYSLLNTHIDIKGKAYEELVGSNLRGDRGEFFTPRNVAKMAVSMINPKTDEKILDPACGTGGFLTLAMNKVIEDLEEIMKINLNKNKDAWTDDEKKVFHDKIKEIAESCFFGFDINPDLVKATKMNMVMNNDGSGNILQNNSLLPPHEWKDEFKTALAEKLNIEKEKLSNKDNIGYFDIILTNPPFGSKIPIKDPNILEQYDLGYIWEKVGDNWIKTDRLQSSVPPEQLFIERCIQLLKDNGRLAIVLPDSILGAPGLEYIRDWLIKKTVIISSIDLHSDTFQPRNGTQTSVLILQKKSKKQLLDEEKTSQMRDYNIFMTMIERIGHDKRGNVIFKRDKYGNDILVPEDNNVIELGEIAEGTKTAQTRSKIKLIDDQTFLVPDVFKEWKKTEGIVW